MLTLVALAVALLLLPTRWGIALVAGAALVDVAEVGAFVWWSRRRLRQSAAAVGIEAIVGRTGVALGRLGDDREGKPGQVRVDGEIWAARARDSIDPGVQVTVSSVEGLVLRVAPARHL